MAGDATIALWAMTRHARTDFIEGPIILRSHGRARSVGYDFSSDLTLTPQNFDTSAWTPISPAITPPSPQHHLNARSVFHGQRRHHHRALPLRRHFRWQATISAPSPKYDFNNVRIPRASTPSSSTTFNG